MEFKIETGVALPASGSLGRTRKYPFGDLEVGQSFTVPMEVYECCQNAGWQYAKRYGIKLAFRKNGEGGRCFRVE